MRVPSALPVVLALAAVAVLRPDLLTGAAGSRRAWLVAAGVVLASVATRLLVRRLPRPWAPAAAPWAGSAVTLGLLAALLVPSFIETTVVEDFPPIAGETLLPPTGPPTTASSADPAADPAAELPNGPAVPASVSPRPSPTRPLPAPSSPAAAPDRVPVAPTAPPSATAAATTTAATRLATGPFQGIDHSASGQGSFYDVGGDTLLRFEGVNFQGTPKPSVHLVRKGARSPDGGTRLGALKAERGSFSYDVGELDVARGWTVLVWCDTYDTPIAAADLSSTA